jgi:hypothetical protein
VFIAIAADCDPRELASNPGSGYILELWERKKKE